MRPDCYLPVQACAARVSGEKRFLRLVDPWHGRGAGRSSEGRRGCAVTRRHYGHFAHAGLVQTGDGLFILSQQFAAGIESDV